MVYDCFQFFNELDILKLRMHVLNDVVDKFVISEATVTFSGEKKPLYFQENREMFKEFEDKIIHKVVDDTPMDTSAFMRDSHQKCAVARGLEGAKDDDIVIFWKKPPEACCPLRVSLRALPEKTEGGLEQRFVIMEC